MNQIILSAKDNYKELDNYIRSNNIDNIFVVCLRSIKRLNIYNYLEKLENVKITYFNDYNPNPTYESVCNGVEKFKQSGSNYIFAIGGGSAMDVAKCIKLYSTLDSNENYLKQKVEENDINLLAVPTTAGTGSEATRYAVIYYNGEKQSVTHDSSIPSVVLFDSSILDTLPIYQKKATVLDALSHSVESIWSVNSTKESKEYAKKSIEIINNYFNIYLNGNNDVNELMLYASNLAGKAINITQTTAGHAMCYKLTSLYGISHGHAAALVNSELLPFMINNLDKCCDTRGKEYLKQVFCNLGILFKLDNIDNFSNYFRNLLDNLDLYDVEVNYDDIDLLVNSVNPTRLKNNPIELNKNDIKEIYINIFNQIKKRRVKNGSK